MICRMMIVTRDVVSCISYVTLRSTPTYPNEGQVVKLTSVMTSYD